MQFYQMSQTISKTSQTSGFVLPLTCSVNNDSGLLHGLFLHEVHVLPKTKTPNVIKQNNPFNKSQMMRGVI